MESKKEDLMMNRKVGKVVARWALLLMLVFLTVSVFVPEAFCKEKVEAKEEEGGWYDNLIFEDKSFSTQLVRALSWTYVQSADIGEVISTARKVKDGDIHSWHDQWLGLANRIYNLAVDWEKKGHTVSASEAYFRATTYFQSAGFYMVAPKDRDKARYCRKRGRESFKKAIAAYPNITFIRIPYKNTTLPGYLAKSEKVSGKGPLVIINTGFDGTAEDSFSGVAWAAIKRGYHCLVFEGPGQGEMIMEKNLPFRHDWEIVGKAVLDYALTLPSVDKDRVAYMGVSMGGYLAPRVMAFDKRIKAGIVNGGLYKLWEAGYALFPKESLELLDKDPEKFNAIAEKMAKNNVSMQWLLDNSAWRFGVKDYASFLIDQKKYDLENVASKITCPMLVTDSESDFMFAGQPEKLYNALKCQKTFIRFTRKEAAQAHCQLGESSLSNEKIFNWLDGVIKPAKDQSMYKFHHIGVVVSDIDEAVKIYSDILGLDPDDESISRFEGKANKTAMVPIGNYEDYNQFELMEPISDSWMDKWIKTEKAAGFLHMAILVDNFDAKVSDLKERGFTVKVEEHVNPFPGCDLLREAYVLPKDASRGILIDLMDAETFPKSLGGLATSPESEE